jgi:hypothetical protein
MRRDRRPVTTGESANVRNQSDMTSLEKIHLEISE